MSLHRLLAIGMLVMSINTFVIAMEQGSISGESDSFANFSITFFDTNDQQKTVYFCAYDFETICENDQIGYLQLYDYEGVLNTLNSATEAERFSTLARENSEQFMHDARLRQRNRRAKLHDQPEVCYAWFVKEVDQNGRQQIIAQVGMGTYGGQKPEKYADVKLFEVGITINKNYRNKKYATRLIPLVIQHLLQYQEFTDVYFCYRTQSQNQVTHKLAASFGFELAMSTSHEVDLGSSTVSVQTDLFVLPLKVSLCSLTDFLCGGNI